MTPTKRQFVVTGPMKIWFPKVSFNATADYEGRFLEKLKEIHHGNNKVVDDGDNSASNFIDCVGITIKANLINVKNDSTWCNMILVEKGWDAVLYTDENGGAKDFLKEHENKKQEEMCDKTGPMFGVNVWNIICILNLIYDTSSINLAMDEKKDIWGLIWTFTERFDKNGVCTHHDYSVCVDASLLDIIASVWTARKDHQVMFDPNKSHFFTTTKLGVGLPAFHAAMNEKGYFPSLVNKVDVSTVLSTPKIEESQEIKPLLPKLKLYNTNQHEFSAGDEIKPLENISNVGMVQLNGESKTISPVIITLFVHVGISKIDPDTMKNTDPTSNGIGYYTRVFCQPEKMNHRSLRTNSDRIFNEDAGFGESESGILVTALGLSTLKYDICEDTYTLNLFCTGYINERKETILYEGVKGGKIPSVPHSDEQKNKIKESKAIRLVSIIGSPLTQNLAKPILAKVPGLEQVEALYHNLFGENYVYGSEAMDYSDSWKCGFLMTVILMALTKKFNGGKSIQDQIELLEFLEKAYQRKLSKDVTSGGMFLSKHCCFTDPIFDNDQFHRCRVLMQGISDVELGLVDGAGRIAGVLCGGYGLINENDGRDYLIITDPHCHMTAPLHEARKKHQIPRGKYIDWSLLGMNSMVNLCLFAGLEVPDMNYLSSYSSYLQNKRLLPKKSTIRDMLLAAITHLETEFEEDIVPVQLRDKHKFSLDETFSRSNPNYKQFSNPEQLTDQRNKCILEDICTRHYTLAVSFLKCMLKKKEYGKSMQYDIVKLVKKTKVGDKVGKFKNLAENQGNVEVVQFFEDIYKKGINAQSENEFLMELTDDQLDIMSRFGVYAITGIGKYNTQEVEEVPVGTRQKKYNTFSWVNLNKPPPGKLQMPLLKDFLILGLCLFDEPSFPLETRTDLHFSVPDIVRTYICKDGHCHSPALLDKLCDNNTLVYLHNDKLSRLTKMKFLGIYEHQNPTRTMYLTVGPVGSICEIVKAIVDPSNHKNAVVMFERLYLPVFISLMILHNTYGPHLGFPYIGFGLLEDTNPQEHLDFLTLEDDYPQEHLDFLTKMTDTGPLVMLHDDDEEEPSNIPMLYALIIFCSMYYDYKKVGEEERLVWFDFAGFADVMNKCCPYGKKLWLSEDVTSLRNTMVPMVRINQGLVDKLELGDNKFFLTDAYGTVLASNDFWYQLHYNGRFDNVKKYFYNEIMTRFNPMKHVRSMMDCTYISGKKDFKSSVKGLYSRTNLPHIRKKTISFNLDEKMPIQDDLNTILYHFLEKDEVKKVEVKNNEVKNNDLNFLEQEQVPQINIEEHSFKSFEEVTEMLKEKGIKKASAKRKKAASNNKTKNTGKRSRGPGKAPLDIEEDEEQNDFNTDPNDDGGNGDDESQNLQRHDETEKQKLLFEQEQRQQEKWEEENVQAQALAEEQAKATAEEAKAIAEAQARAQAEAQAIADAQARAQAKKRSEQVTRVKEQSKVAAEEAGDVEARTRAMTQAMDPEQEQKKIQKQQLERLQQQIQQEQKQPPKPQQQQQQEGEKNIGLFRKLIVANDVTKDEASTASGETRDEVSKVIATDGKIAIACAQITSILLSDSVLSKSTTGDREIPFLTESGIVGKYNASTDKITSETKIVPGSLIDQTAYAIQNIITVDLATYVKSYVHNNYEWFIKNFAKYKGENSEEEIAALRQQAHERHRMHLMLQMLKLHKGETVGKWHVILKELMVQNGKLPESDKASIYTQETETTTHTEHKISLEDFDDAIKELENLRTKFSDGSTKSLISDLSSIGAVRERKASNQPMDVIIDSPTPNVHGPPSYVDNLPAFQNVQKKKTPHVRKAPTFLEGLPSFHRLMGFYDPCPSPQKRAVPSPSVAALEMIKKRRILLDVAAEQKTPASAALAASVAAAGAAPKPTKSTPATKAPGPSSKVDTASAPKPAKSTPAVATKAPGPSSKVHTSVQRLTAKPYRPRNPSNVTSASTDSTQVEGMDNDTDKKEKKKMREESITKGPPRE